MVDIAATRNKLAEAQFFLDRLEGEDVKIGVDTSPFRHYLSAFLSAGRSVTFALQKEAKTTYSEWFPSWRESLLQDEQRLLAFMNDQRNLALKEGTGPATPKQETAVIEEVVGIEFINGAPVFMKKARPPGRPWARSVAIVHEWYFEVDGKPARVLDMCRRYVAILNRLVNEFPAFDRSSSLGAN
jgi:hypothetical protein